ncbi:hypothetical protein SAMN05421858_3615 [Haladaptatus litoreus]|uniref:Uncharacterized protein n=1 Tax=Haladaptatus litoreus TaxID=553468 RepID=A0A1N7DH82_9EURY|nr:hypothetical protein SAMN05421858_3615 [Haladaptatus litoreus]
MTEGVRCSAYSRIKAAFPPICNGRFTGTEYRPSLRDRVFSLLGTTISVRRPVGPDVVEWASTFLPRDESMQSIGTVKDRVRQRGNIGSIGGTRERLIVPFVEYLALLSAAVAGYFVGFIPALKGEAFSSNLRKRHQCGA